MNTKKLSKAEIASLVKEEVEGVRGMLKNLLAKKINFYETRADAIKSSTPGISQASATGEIINFLQSFEEQIKDLQLELLDAPTSDTVRRVKGLLSYVKSNLPKLDESDVRKVLDNLLGLVYFTVVDNNRTARKGAKPAAVLNKNLSKSSIGKAGDIRRYLQDLIIRSVRELAGQFLKSFDYPKNYEDLRDYFDLNTQGRELADKLNAEKDKITEEREALIQQQADNAKSLAEADADKAKAEEDLAKQIEDADKQRAKALSNRLDEEASILWNILGGDDNAWWSVVGFSAEFYDVSYLKAYENLRSHPETLKAILLDMRGVAQSKGMVFDEFAEYGAESKQATIAEAIENVDDGNIPPDFRPTLMAVPLEDLRANLSPEHEGRIHQLLDTKNLAELRQYVSGKLDGKLGDINRRYKKFPSQMNKDSVTKLIIIERLY